jgi:hypothetical protein
MIEKTINLLFRSSEILSPDPWSSKSLQFLYWKCYFIILLNLIHQLKLILSFNLSLFVKPIFVSEQTNELTSLLIGFAVLVILVATVLFTVILAVTFTVAFTTAAAATFTFAFDAASRRSFMEKKIRMDYKY